MADIKSALAPLRQAAQQVQLAGDFDANLQFAQLQRDSPQVYAQVQQALLHSRRSLDVDCVFELEVWLSLWHAQRQSLILDSNLSAKLAPFLKGLELKVSMAHC